MESIFQTFEKTCKFLNIMEIYSLELLGTPTFVSRRAVFIETVFFPDASGLIKFWHYTSGKCLGSIDETRQTLSCAWNPTGNSFITCGADPQIIRYDAETKQAVHIMEPRYSLASVKICTLLIASCVSERGNIFGSVYLCLSVFLRPAG